MEKNAVMFEKIKKARVNRLVYENLLDVVDEIRTKFAGKIDLELVRNTLLQQLRNAKEILKRTLAHYKDTTGIRVPHITNHRRVRARDAGTSRRDFDTDDERDTGEDEDSKSSHSESEEEGREQAGNTQRVSPAVERILENALHDAGKNRENARKFIASIADLTDVIHGLQQEIAAEASEKEILVHEAAETGRESAQFGEKMRESQQHIDMLNRALLKEKETRATFEGRVRSLEEKARMVIQEMKEIRQEHSEGLDEIQESMAGKVEREVMETLAITNDELGEEGSGDDSDSEGSNKDDVVDDKDGSGGVPEPDQDGVESLYARAEDLNISASAVVEGSGVVRHEIAEIEADIEHKEGQIEALREEADRSPGDTEIADTIQEKSEEREELREDLKAAEQKLAEKQAEIKEIQQEIQAVSDQATALSNNIPPEDVADVKTLKEAKEMATRAMKTLATVVRKPTQFQGRQTKGSSTPSTAPPSQAFQHRTVFSQSTKTR